jgi:cytochrome b561
MKSRPYSPHLAGLKKHHPMTIAMHWGTVVCLVVAVFAIMLREYIGDKHWRQLLMSVHLQLGLIVMLGVGVRLFIRLRHGLANHTHNLPTLMRLAAFSVQLALYAMLVALPLLGWASINGHNLSVRFLGLLSLPALTGEDSEWADQLSDYHLLGAWLLFGLVMLHAGAAFFHHFIRRDTVLWAMLPVKNDSIPELSEKPLRQRRARLFK